MKSSLLTLVAKIEPNMLDAIIAKEKDDQMTKCCTSVTAKPLRRYFIIIGVVEYHANELNTRIKTMRMSF